MKTRDVYFTNEHLAKFTMAVTHKHVPKHRYILDPCAGDGALVKAAITWLNPKRVDAIEIDRDLCDRNPGFTCADFLTVNPKRVYDVVICNPPFRNKRKRGQNQGQFGKNMVYAFLAHASKFSHRLVFIQPAASWMWGWTESMAKIAPMLERVAFYPVKPQWCLFETASGAKQIPVSVAVYKVHNTKRWVPQIKLFPSTMRTAHFILLRLNDDRCNLIVKRWSSPKRVGAVVTQDPKEIQQQVKRIRSGYHQSQGTNMHLLSLIPVDRLVDILTGEFRRKLDKVLRPVRYCNNISLSGRHFCGLYNELIIKDNI